MDRRVDNNILELLNIHAGYKQLEVLHGINLNIKYNEVVTLLGANGAGKSTLVMTIMGILSAKAGKIIYNQQDITNLQTHQIAHLGISLVPEGRRIFPNMSIEDNLKLGNTCSPNPHDYSYLNEIYSIFPILKKREKSLAGNLSGGEQQMLAIGRALMSKPKLLLLDEPSLGLAPKIVKQIYSILNEIMQNNKETALFLIEQNINHAIHLASRYYIMTNGSLVKHGSREEFLADPDVEKHYLGTALV